MANIHTCTTVHTYVHIHSKQLIYINSRVAKKRSKTLLTFSVKKYKVIFLYINFFAYLYDVPLNEKIMFINKHDMMNYMNGKSCELLQRILCYTSLPRDVVSSLQSYMNASFSHLSVVISVVLALGIYLCSLPFISLKTFSQCRLTILYFFEFFLFSRTLRIIIMFYEIEPPATVSVCVLFDKKFHQKEIWKLLIFIILGNLYITHVCL